MHLSWHKAGRFITSTPSVHPGTRDPAALWNARDEESRCTTSAFPGVHLLEVAWCQRAGCGWMWGILVGVVFKEVVIIPPGAFAPCEALPRKFQLHPELSPEEALWVGQTGNAWTGFGVGVTLAQSYRATTRSAQTQCDEVEHWMLPRKDVVYSYVRGLVWELILRSYWGRVWTASSCIHRLRWPMVNQMAQIFIFM